MCLSGPNYVGHCIVKFLAAGWWEETWLEAARQWNVRGTIGGNGSIDERRTKWIFLCNVSAGGWARRRAAMLADTKGTAPDSRFHWSSARCSGVWGDEGRTVCGVSSLQLHLRSPPRASRSRVCVRDRCNSAVGVGAWVSTQLQTCAWPVDTVCVVSTCAIRAAHARALSNFREGPVDSPSRFLEAEESRARKRPSDWIDRNFKYILRPDGSSGEPRWRPLAGLWKISSISTRYYFVNLKSAADR